MTTRNDLHDVETRLRASLGARAGDVETTPALYQRVQRQAVRGTWLRRGLAVAGAAAAVAVTVAVVPPLLRDPTPFDVVDTPEESLPSDVPTAAEDRPPTTGQGLPAALAAADVAVADGSGRLTVADRVVLSPTGIVSLAVSPTWTPEEGVVVAGLGDGSIGVVDQQGGGDGFDLLVDAGANGGGVVFAPGGAGIAWIEGSDLHVLPLSGAPDGARVLPLVGDVPRDLRIEQWFAGADAQVVLASDPAGGVWRIPMDDSDVFNSAPTLPASRLPAGADSAAVDAALLPDLSIAVLRVPADGTEATLDLGGLPVPVPEVRDAGTELSVTGPSLVLFDPVTGVGSRRDADLDSIDLTATWEVPDLVAVAPLPRVADDASS